MASPNCCSQLSQDGKYLAYCGNDGKLKIWETATSRLKQEYIPNLHLSSPCSVLAWISVTRRSNINSNSPWNKRRRKSVAEEGEEAGMVAMGSVNGDVILYDVAAGSVSKQLQNGHAGVVTAIDWSETSGLFTAAKDRQIVEWNVKKNGIKSKWKSGKEKITSIVILQDGNSLISASRSIKWWDLATKRLIMSFAGHASLITSLNPVVINGESCYLISGASGDRQLNVWSLNKENMDKTSVGILAMQDEAVSVSTHVSEDSGMEVLAITRLGRAQLFKQQSNGRSSKPLKPALNVVVETSRGAKKSIQPIQILTAKLTEDSKLLLAYGSYLNITFERVTPDFTDKLQHLLRAETKKLREKNELGISKLKATSVDRDVEYPVTTTSRTAVKRSRMSDAGSQLPMEVRLGNLSLKTAANTPDETPTKVTSMAQLLMQGLHSKDKAILRDVLLTQDETMVKNTVARLPIETIAPLLKELTAMLQGRTQSTRIAITWLKMMVQTFAGHLLSYPDLGDLLEPILGTVDAKLNLLPELCRLKGRVALLTGQISQASQKQDKINEESLLIYQDSDTQRWTNPLGHPLKVEAEDIEHLISVLNDENEVPPKTLKKLKKLRVILQHKVPPQHMVESCAGSRGPTHEQKDIIKKFGPIKCGKYTPDEDKVIVKNWKSFCRVHDWDARDIKAFLYMRHPHSKYTAKLSQRQKFVQYLANGLPWRTLYSVYYRFRNLYQPHSATRYTEDEDGLIIAHMEKNSSTDTRNVRKFSELGKILHRTRASVWRRYRLLKKRRNPDQNHRRLFGYAETTQPLTLSKDVHELKDLDIPLAVWNKLSEKFEIDHKELKQFWHTKLHMQLFCKKSVYLNDVKINLYVSGIKERWEIEWDKITKVFDGMTSLFLSSIFNNVVYDERLEGKELGEILEHSHQVKKPRLRQAATDECLPKLVFKHGSLIVFDLDKKRIRYFDSTLSMLKNNHDNNCY